MITREPPRYSYLFLANLQWRQQQQQQQQQQLLLLLLLLLLVLQLQLQLLLLLLLLLLRRSPHIQTDQTVWFFVMDFGWQPASGFQPMSLPGIAKACRPSQHYQASRVLVGCFLFSQEKRRKLGSKSWLSMFEKDQFWQECGRLKWSMSWTQENMCCML